MGSLASSNQEKMRPGILNAGILNARILESRADLPVTAWRRLCAACAQVEFQLELRLQARGAWQSRLGWFRDRRWAFARHRNRPAARVEERVGWRLRRAFCGAACARASICACKAFNTDVRAGSIRRSWMRTMADSGRQRRGLERSDLQ